MLTLVILIFYMIFRINKIILWVPTGKPIPYWVYFLGLDFNLDVSGFLQVGYKLGWVICGLGWAGLFYPTLTSLDPVVIPAVVLFVYHQICNEFDVGICYISVRVPSQLPYINKP